MNGMEFIPIILICAYVLTTMMRSILNYIFSPLEDVKNITSSNDHMARVRG